MMGQSQRTVLITGCSKGGIGAGLALEFQRRGFCVFATARNTDRIPSAITSLPSVTALPLDVTSQDSIRAAVQTISESTNGGLDVLVNNSGAALTTPALEVDIDTVRQIYEVNVFGLLAVSQAFAKMLVKGTSPILVNNSSIAGVSPPPYQGTYGSSKTAATVLSESMRLEMEPLGVKVMTVITGLIDTNLHANEAPRTFPETSLYKPLQPYINDFIAGKYRTKTMPVEHYAKAFVQNVENGITGKVYIGPISGLMKYVQWWMPTMIWDYVMRMNGPPAKDNEALKRRAEAARSNKSE